ncbi:MAG: hypothetical protein K2J88_06770, partial [Oscillospiraceae bacterium]|nr:hypothetical protein [Oscillospiraceae bacterium]
MELKLKNCKIIIDFGFPAMLALVFLQSENDFMRKILLVCMIHELGHGFVMCCTGAGVREIKLHATGLQMLTNTCLLSTGQAVCIYISGPVLNLIFAFLFWNINLEIAMLHASMGIFNLLPYRVLDGGAMLRCVFSHKAEFLKIISIFCSLLSVMIILISYYYQIKNPVIY